MMLDSTHLLRDFPHSTLKIISVLMEEVLKYNPKEIKEFEKENGISWGSFLQILSLYELGYSLSKWGPKQTSSGPEPHHIGFR